MIKSSEKLNEGEFMGEYFSKLNWPQITNVLIAVAIWLQVWLIKQQVFPKTRMPAERRQSEIAR